MHKTYSNWLNQSTKFQKKKKASKTIYWATKICHLGKVKIKVVFGHAFQILVFFQIFFNKTDIIDDFKETWDHVRLIIIIRLIRLNIRLTLKIKETITLNQIIYTLFQLTYDTYAYVAHRRRVVVLELKVHEQIHRLT